MQAAHKRSLLPRLPALVTERIQMAKPVCEKKPVPSKSQEKFVFIVLPSLACDHQCED